MPDRPDFTVESNTPHGFYGDRSRVGTYVRTCSCGFSTASRDEWWYHRFEECAGRDHDEQQDGLAAFTQATEAARQ